MIPPVRLGETLRPIVAKVSTVMLPALQVVDPLITGVHYLYGHRNDIKEKLRQLGANGSTARYPLIVLFEDYRITVNRPGIVGVADVLIMILHTTKKEYTRDQRETFVFAPVLVPIYNEFLKQLKVSGKFMQYGPFPHTRIDRPHWGDPGLYASKAYIFDDILDGIELNDLSLQIYQNECITA